MVKRDHSKKSDIQCNIYCIWIPNDAKLRLRYLQFRLCLHAWWFTKSLLVSFWDWNTILTFAFEFDKMLDIQLLKYVIPKQDFEKFNGKVHPAEVD